MHHQLADPVRVRQTTWRNLPLLKVSQRRHRGADRQDKRQEQAIGLQTPPQLAGVQSSSGQANTSNGKEGWAVVRSSRCALRPGSIYPEHTLISSPLHCRAICRWSRPSALKRVAGYAGQALPLESGVGALEQSSVPSLVCTAWQGRWCRTSDVSSFASARSRRAPKQPTKSRPAKLEACLMIRRVFHH